MSPADRDALSLSFLPISGSRPVEWRISDELVDYETALREMDERVQRIIAGEADEQVWLLEHPRSTPPAPAPRTAILSLPTAFRSTGQGAVDSTPTMGPGNA